jgi:hypothetical protein
MTAHTKTISNTLRVYSPEPTTKWGSFLWGSGIWGYTDVPWTFYKSVSDSISIATAEGKQVTHYLGIPLALSMSISREFPARFFDTLVLSSKIASVYLINNNWYVTRGGETNALNWPRDAFGEGTEPTTVWSEVTQPTTTWVQA